jgi:hypothetical protein
MFFLYLGYHNAAAGIIDAAARYRNKQTDCAKAGFFRPSSLTLPPVLLKF